MDSNENRVQKHVVPNSPSEGSEVETGRGPRESGFSRGTIIKIAILAVTAIVIVLIALSISDRLVSIGNQTGMPILDRQESSTLSFVAWIVIGLVIGFIGSKLLNKTGRGRGRDCLIGIVGAFVSGFLANLLGKPDGPGLDLYSLLVAAVGAVVFMIVYHALFRRRRFLSMRSKQPAWRDVESDDANMQEVATSRLNDEPDMATVSIAINAARAVLTGTVNSEGTKAKAEQIVEAVRGVKSVENQIVVSGR
ncbi:MAG TPA: BON domain-containing protein [Pyrinomonadaceae bacterium]|nr:BON domain-containing protein [Pyrinomonadaceae bacterium]